MYFYLHLTVTLLPPKTIIIDLSLTSPKGEELVCIVVIRGEELVCIVVTKGMSCFVL